MPKAKIQNNIFLATMNEKGISQTFHSRYKCDFQTLSYFTKCLEDKVLEMQIGNCLEEYLKDFME